MKISQNLFSCTSMNYSLFFTLTTVGRLVKGYAAYSYGIYCAFISGMIFLTGWLTLLLGIPAELIERAQQIAATLQKGEPLLPINKTRTIEIYEIVKLLKAFDPEKSNLKEFLTSCQSHM